MNTVSIILPTYNPNDPIIDVIQSLANQTHQPLEIIIIDSSPNQIIENIIKSLNSKISIIYHWIPKAYPGHARNIGISQSKGDMIAFIDSKTIAYADWIEKYINYILDKDISFVIGKTKYFSNTYFQKLLQSATFGNLVHSTLPGSIFKSKYLKSFIGFVKNMRAGEDQVFFSQLSIKKINLYKEYDNYLIYQDLPKDLFTCLKKYLVYSFHTALSNIQIQIKFSYLLIFILFLYIINLKAEKIFFNYENNLISFTLVFFFLVILGLFFLVIIKIFTNKYLFHYIYNFIPIGIFIFLTILIYRWNNDIAQWTEESFLYIPHITKIYIFFILIISLIFRGLILPINRKVEKSFLFPNNWIKIGIIGMFIDLVKSPGYIFGSLISPIIMIISLIKKTQSKY